MESTLSAANPVLTFGHTSAGTAALPATVRAARGLALASCALACLAVPGAHAGVFGGYQANGEDNRFAFAGYQHVRNRMVYELFAAHLEYTYLDGGGEVSAEQRIITPTIGWRWQDTWSVTAMIGPTFVAKEEEGARTTDSDNIGGTVKLGVSQWQPELSKEVLASYTTLDRLLWGRARIGRALNERFSLGGEAVGMSGENADSYGAGLLFDVRGGVGRLGFNVGYERSTNGENTVYGGVEVSAFF